MLKKDIYFFKLTKIQISLIGIIIYSFLLLMISIFSLNSLTSLQINGLYLILCVLLFLIRYYKDNKVIFSPFILFYISFLCFTSGHIFLMAIGIDPVDISYIWSLDSFTVPNIFNSVTFTIYSIQFFHLGYYVSQKINFKINLPTITQIKGIDFNKILKYIFYISIFSSIILVIYLYIKTDDYSSIYNMDFGKIYNILYLLSLFSIPTYLLINVNLKKLDRNCSYMLLLVIVLNFFIGKRGMAIMFLIPLFFTFLKNLKSISFWRVLLFFTFAYLMINLIVTISYTRTSDFNMLSFLKTYFYHLITLDSIKLLIGEMGFSIRPLVEVVNLISNDIISPTFGGTYLYSIFLVLPGFLRFGLDNFAIEHNLINLAAMVTHYSGANYGLGFSVMAEAFFNFQYFGIFFFIILGIVLGKLLEGKIFKNENTNYLFNIAVISFLIVFPRSPMQDTIRKILIYCIIPFALYNIFFIEEGKNESNKENN